MAQHKKILVSSKGGYMSNKKDHISPWLTNCLQTKHFGKNKYAQIILSDDIAKLKKEAGKIPSWKKNDLNNEAAFPLYFDGEFGPVCLTLVSSSKNKKDLWPTLEGQSLWAKGRDLLGETYKVLESHGLENLHIKVISKNASLLESVVVGLELAHYSFKGRKKSFEKVFIEFNGKTSTLKEIKESVFLGHAINWARHLVNLPPNRLQPEDYAGLVKTLFSKKSGVKIDVWNDKKLKAEKCGLHLAVGGASDSPPCLVVLKYRPQKASAKSKTYALVGKGITFDTGGLDLKPPSGMRLMKKDMGGSAAVVGAFLYAVENQLPIKLDAYLALAENSVSSSSFRPSDLVTARNGQVIEIHNTDAEGRLVLADALDVATTQREKPEIVIDVATLTGAIKVGLGSQIAGLFSNDSTVSKEIYTSFSSKGDDVWPMPLYQKYRQQMNSPFADMTNAVDGFGGAITAALFLESFVNDVPWAHIDIYAWKDSPEGALLEPGGSGQAVQGLATWLKSKCP